MVHLNPVLDRLLFPGLVLDLSLKYTTVGPQAVDDVLHHGGARAGDLFVESAGIVDDLNVAVGPSPVLDHFRIQCTRLLRRFRARVVVGGGVELFSALGIPANEINRLTQPTPSALSLVTEWLTSYAVPFTVSKEIICVNATVGAASRLLAKTAT